MKYPSRQGKQHNIAMVSNDTSMLDKPSMSNKEILQWRPIRQWRVAWPRSRSTNWVKWYDGNYSIFVSCIAMYKELPNTSHPLPNHAHELMVGNWHWLFAPFTFDPIIIPWFLPHCVENHLHKCSSTLRDCHSVALLDPWVKLWSIPRQGELADNICNVLLIAIFLTAAQKHKTW